MIWQFWFSQGNHIILYVCVALEIDTAMKRWTSSPTLVANACDLVGFGNSSCEFVTLPSNMK